jgi:hypothetical protein
VNFRGPLCLALDGITCPDGAPVPPEDSPRNPDPGAELATVQALLQLGAGTSPAPSNHSQNLTRTCVPLTQVGALCDEDGVLNVIRPCNPTTFRLE